MDNNNRDQQATEDNQIRFIDLTQQNTLVSDPNNEKLNGISFNTNNKSIEIHAKQKALIELYLGGFQLVSTDIFPGISHIKVPEKGVYILQIIINKKHYSKKILIG